MPGLMDLFTQKVDPNFLWQDVKVDPKMAEQAAMAAMFAAPAGIFVGPGSSMWNANNAFKAQQMLNKGVAPEQVWKETGTFKSLDDLLRQEIDDSASKFTDLEGVLLKADDLKRRAADIKEILKPSPQTDLFPKQLAEAKRPLREEAKSIKNELSDVHGPAARSHMGNYAPYALEHEQLYKAYPELRNMIIRQGTEGSPGVKGSMSGDQIDITLRGLLDNPRSTSLHEMQHAVQDIEGFGRGGSASMAFADPAAHDILAAMRKDAAKTIDGGKVPDWLDRQLQSAAANQYYKNLAGEAEARAVQARMDLTPSQRAERFPLLDFDVSPQDAIKKHVGQFYDSNSLWGF